MILKPFEREESSNDRRRRAGAGAERQMAFYLHRELASENELIVLNDLRLVDADQPEPDGRPGVAQIDHLVLHRWGAFIVESKSVTEKVTVRGDGAGGDEWSRTFRGREQGFPSPLAQAGRQGKLMRELLNRHRAELLERIRAGARTIARIALGTDQRGFRGMPIQRIVAISDRGTIRRVDGWKPDERPCQDFVCKADQVPTKIGEEWRRHRNGASLIKATDGEYGLWQIRVEELEAVAKFLLEWHVAGGSTDAAETPAVAAIPSVPKAPPTRKPVAPRADPPPPPSPVVATTAPPSKSAPAGAIVCRGCGGKSLTAHWGKYGYYWKCADCSGNTPMPTSCSICGAEGTRGRTVRIRKESAKYFRACEACGIDECIWTEGAPARAE